MSGDSSSDFSVIARKKKKISKTRPKNFQAMLNLDPVVSSAISGTKKDAFMITIPENWPLEVTPPTMTQGTKIVAPTMSSNTNPKNAQKKSNLKFMAPLPKPAVVFKNSEAGNRVASESSVTQYPPSEPIALNVSSTSMSQSLIPVATATLQPINLPPSPHFDQPYIEFDPNELPEAITLTSNSSPASELSMLQCLTYMQQFIDLQHKSDAMITTRIMSLEKRIAHLSTQIEFVMDAIQCGQQPSAEVFQSYKFDIINDARKLADFENNLEDSTFKHDFMRWLRINVNGDCADNRMICALDLIMSKQFQTECTWTGASRKGPKIALMVHRQTLKVFEEIGTCDTEIVTQQKLANFFMKKLKNANKRLKASGQRQFTSCHC
ncbi:uncharacterized protein LOC131682101 [Topomyia yanbarensis]|uniref:uncharacterized protein LOC131682101 n=1 Tax=Topomyia yanbarensis TaxID=2498891 RepID=UPI00273C0F9B|nr:uncharacterized protein LOC131682101 [Topomyia yanbarensis]